MSEFVIMGRTAGLYGVKGWLKVHSYTQPRQGILEYQTWYLRQGKTWQPWIVEDGRIHGKGLVVCLEGCNDREIAATINGLDIAVPRDQLPEVGDRDFYWRDLIGSRVKTTAGYDLGVVKALMETGSNDVLVVKGERERLIPFILDQVVVEVDQTDGSITVDWDPDF